MIDRRTTIISKQIIPTRELSDLIAFQLTIASKLQLPFRNLTRSASVRSLPHSPQIILQNLLGAVLWIYYHTTPLYNCVSRSLTEGNVASMF